MEVCLSYSGINDSISFSPILVLMVANEFLKGGFEVSIEQTEQDPDFFGIPSDNIFSPKYQRALDILEVATGRRPKLDELSLNYEDVPKCKIVGLTTSFGCRYHCSYCPNDKMGYVERPLETVLEELNQICSEHDYFEFFDNNVLQNVDFLNIMHLIPPGKQWGALINIDDISDELLKEMHNCGCVNLYMGVETFNEDDLKYLKKPYQAKGIDPKEFILRVRKAGIEPYVFMMRGLPNERTGEFTNGEEWLMHNRIHYTVSRFHVDGEPSTEFKNVSKTYVDSFITHDMYVAKCNLYDYLVKYFYK